jgi:hypothetical protein
MTKTSINKTALLTILLAMLATANDARAATPNNVNKVQTGQALLNQKLNLQSDSVINHYISSLNTKISHQVGKNIATQCDLTMSLVTQ